VATSGLIQLSRQAHKEAKYAYEQLV